ncbi:hypothetical protein [Dongia sp. agr-C8]
MPSPSPARPPLIARPYPVRGTNARSGLPPFIAPGRGAAQAPKPITDYAHILGQGNRTGLITVSGSFTPDGGTFDNLVDGSTAVGSGDAIDMPGTGGTAIADGDHILFDFGVPVFVEEISIDFKTGANMGAWGWWAGPDLGNWSRFGGNTWNADTLVTPVFGYPFAGLRYGKWMKEGAGVNFTNNWLTEFTFKIAYGNPA